uniref:Uncharacterized protein n=1 Tax=Anaerolinea thermolimosa TaxID=229919 RepID=A0A7C4PME7_9CHLR
MKQINGLLYSQIGYDLGCPMRAIIRSTDPSYVPEGSHFVVKNAETGETAWQGPLYCWGTIWQSTWWIMDFSQITLPGRYQISVERPGVEPLTSGIFEIGDQLLWSKSIIPVALDQLEIRAKLARNGKGWKDCGSEWRETNSHATTLIGLTDLLNWGYMYLSAAEVERLVQQVIVGGNYLAACQDLAEQSGLGQGAVVHEIPNYLIVIPGDVVQSATAWARAARLIYEWDPARSIDYLNRAEHALRYFLKQARPYGAAGFSHSNHGAPAGFVVPKDWMTRDLMMALWAGVELWKAGRLWVQEEIVRLAREIISRQVPEEQAEGGLYGHFYLFPGCGFTEKANTHHHVGHDTGSTFPHYLTGLIEMARLLYDHPEAQQWREAVRKFAYGYFLPACRSNPFFLLPEGYFLGEGLLTFCGPWHGINTSIGFAAALAAQLESFLGDSAFREVAVGNLQWIAGLHAGITRESLAGCQFWHEDIPEGQALPYSQIYGVGERWVGNWTGIPGTIPNGFSTNPQFQLVVPPTRENDGPWLYTDEDWIPHAAGWISALTHLRQVRVYRG